jgi:hypothetical protein
MTRTISYIIGIAVLALVAVPAAFGEGRLAGSDPQDGVAYFKANELSTLVQQAIPGTSVATYRDSQPGVVESPAARAERLRGEGLNKMYGLGAFSTSVNTYKDANQRIAESPSARAERLRGEGLNKMYGLGDFAATNNYKDANQRVDLPTTPVVEPVTSSGIDIEWPQVGIGFSVGILLAIALGLSFRATRQRGPLAH